jgi:hypothetical protein
MDAVKEVLAQRADEIGHVWMDIRPNGGGYTIEDPFLRIRLEADRSLDDFRFSGWLDNGFFNMTSRRVFMGRKDHTLNGSGTFLDLRQFGGFGKDYILSGTLVTQDRKSHRLDVNFRYDEYRRRYSISGSGLSLTLDMDNRFELNGSADFKVLPKDGLAAVACAATLVVNDAGPERERSDRGAKPRKKD